MGILSDMTALELREMIKCRKHGIEELTRYYIGRIEALDSKLNTVSELNESAIAQARRLDEQKTARDGILYGLPILVKDNIDVAGLHTTAGSLALTDNIAKTNAPIIDNIIRNGGIILGKTNMTEFANFTSDSMPNGFSSKGGRVINAYDPDRDPGGSSTGSAVAVSAGFCAMAVGTDTSFSVVGCATDNGIAGFKPAHANLSSRGIIPISATLDSAGALGRRLSDAILLYNGMRDKPMPEIQPIPVNELRIGVNMSGNDIVSEAQMDRYARVLDVLRHNGAKYEQISQPAEPRMFDIMLCEFGRDLGNYLANSAAKCKSLDEIIECYQNDPERMMPYGISLLQQASRRNTEDALYKEIMAEREQTRIRIIQDIEKYDACIMTGPTNIMHFSGLPSLALTMCVADDGIPRGMILYGADERRLLAAALTIEAHCVPFYPPKEYSQD